MSDFENVMKKINQEKKKTKNDKILAAFNGETVQRFFVISIEESTLDKPRFWREKSEGYTYEQDKAGQYSYRDIIAANLCEDIIIPVNAISYLKNLSATI